MGPRRRHRRRSRRSSVPPLNQVGRPGRRTERPSRWPRSCRTRARYREGLSKILLVDRRNRRGDLRRPGPAPVPADPRRRRPRLVAGRHACSSSPWSACCGSCRSDETARPTGPAASALTRASDAPDLGRRLRHGCSTSERRACRPSTSTARAAGPCRHAYLGNDQGPDRARRPRRPDVGRRSRRGPRGRRHHRARPPHRRHRAAPGRDGPRRWSTPATRFVMPGPDRHPPPPRDAGLRLRVRGRAAVARARHHHDPLARHRRPTTWSRSASRSQSGRAVAPRYFGHR